METAWSEQRWRERLHRCDAAVNALGVHWRPVEAGESDVVNAVLGANVEAAGTWEARPASAAVFILDSRDEQIGVVLLTVHRFEGQRPVVHLEHLAVEQGWRGRGIGSATLAKVPVVMGAFLGGADPVYVATCPTARVDFFRDCGYTVLEEGSSLPPDLAYASGVVAGGPDPVRPCWLFQC